MISFRFNKHNRLAFETLESKTLLAGDVFGFGPWEADLPENDLMADSGLVAVNINNSHHTAGDELAININNSHRQLDETVAVDSFFDVFV